MIRVRAPILAPLSTPGPGTIAPATITSGSALGAITVAAVPTGTVAPPSIGPGATLGPIIVSDPGAIALDSIGPSPGPGPILVTDSDGFDGDPDDDSGLTQVFSGVGEVSQILQPMDLTSAPEEGVALSRRVEPRLRKLWQVRVHPCSPAFAEVARLAHRRTHGSFWWTPRGGAPRRVVFWGEGVRVTEHNAATRAVTATLLELAASD